MVEFNDQSTTTGFIQNQTLYNPISFHSHSFHFIKPLSSFCQNIYIVYNRKVVKKSEQQTTGITHLKSLQHSECD